MKVLIIFIFFIINTMFVYADVNDSNFTICNDENNLTLTIADENPVLLTLDHMDQIGSILEPSAQILAAQINSFGDNLTIFVTIFIALLSAFGYLVVFKPYSSNKEKIEKAIDKIDKTIEKEVKNQIIYSTDGELDKAKAYAVKKIDFEIKNVKKTAYEKLFDYQELVYEVNQTIKTESDEILAQEDSNYEDKLKKIISLQYIYNEITNHDLPKLFSDDITIIVGISKQLSEHKNIKSIIIIYLSGLLKLDKWSLEEKEEIKKVLKDYFKYMIS